MLWLKLVQVIIFQMHFAKEAVAQISPNDENVNLGMLQFSEIFDFIVVFYFNFKRKCGRQSYSIPNFLSPSINSVNDFPLDSNILSQKPPFGPCMPFLDPLFLFWAHYSFFGPCMPFYSLPLSVRWENHFRVRDKKFLQGLSIPAATKGKPGDIPEYICVGHHKRK